MVGDVIHPHNTVFFGPGVYEAVTKVESHCLTQFFRECHVTTGLVFLGPGWYSGQWHGAQGRFPAIQWWPPPL